ncbi:inter-alpha-trypsin inhibitor heavy chain H6 isoform X2 [Bombina bombina]|uniref:inter-alpha-trypsin inhibitor heavy chain H6 isoform X2 n=1 Tax=Bombina bombina TaxID=8345 RepID=UPI00235A7A88|nr:inter-alpha-trypsin inhibitor heavy chain H6 isoform X2 [Bombina bombina]
MSDMGRLSTGYLLLVLISITYLGSSQGTDQSPYVERFKRQLRTQKTELTISSLFIQSTIVSRYAFTKVQTIMVNPHSEGKEAIFDLELPSSAFISNFTLTIKGKTYIAEVKEKHQAKKMYDEARRQGKTTAHVGTRDRETEKFRVSVNVEAGGQIAFTLTYEELLRRQLGKYEHGVSVRPGQVVQNLTVEVTVSERTGIEYIRVLPLRTSRLLTNTVRGDTEIPPSTNIEKGTHCARVTFTPSPAEQVAQSSTGIAADFVIQYDVTLKDLAGDVQIYNGYFVHYFAPRGLPTIQKNVIFVIDVSGSMFGTKIKQTKSAMHVILNDLHREDFFNIITFSDSVHVWRPGRSIQATAQNIKSAKDFVNKIEADGWTDINAALMAAASIFNQTSNKLEKEIAKQKIPLIIFLTDGEATFGVTSTSRILANAQKSMGGTISLFGLAFGEDADYNLMRRLSLENRGIARRIYEYSDATLQLKGFYDEIASPLLFDIELAYLGDKAQNVTQTLFPNYFEGSELVVTGKLKPGTKDLHVRLTAHDQKEKLSLENDITIEGNGTEPCFGCSGNVDQIQWFVQRLWAYFTIQDLLQARVKANDTLARRLLTEKATNLSLKYNFVTPVTSLIVVKPEEEDDLKATTSSMSTTAAPTSGTSATPLTNTVPTLSTTSQKTKVTSGPRLTKPAMKGSKFSTTTTLSPARQTSTRSTIAIQAAGTTGHSMVTATSIATMSVFEKLTTVAPALMTTLIPSSDPQSSVLPHRTAALRPRTTVSVGTTKPKSSPAVTPVTSLTSTISSTVSTTDYRPELGTQTTSVYPEVTSKALTERVSDGAQGTSSPSLPTSVPVNPTYWRLLILPDETELLSATDLYPTYVESLNHPPIYSYISKTFAGDPEIYDADGFYDEIVVDEEFDGYTDGAPGLQTFMSSVDGDPHFVVNLPGRQEKLCFTLDGRPGDILRLLSDPVSGITVNGHLRGAPLKVGYENRLRTYFDVITIIINRPRTNYIVNVSLDMLTLKGEDQLTLPINRPALIHKARLAIKISPSSNITVWIERNVKLLILFHHYKHPTYLQLDHLGFYIVKGDGLSSASAGLLGQFQKATIEFDEKKQSNEPTLSAVVTRNNQKAPATLVVKTLKDSSAQAHTSQCWLVKHGEIEQILDGKYISYVVSDLAEM